MTDTVAAGQLRAFVDEAASLDRVIELLAYARGNTERDMNRAIDQAAKVLGVNFKEMHRLLKLSTMMGSFAAVKRFERSITIRPDTGFVYFAEDIAGNRIKIGFSVKPEVRIGVVARMADVDLVEIARFSGHMLNEHIAHVMARPALIGGEWYDAKILRSLHHYRFLKAMAESEAA